MSDSKSVAGMIAAEDVERIQGWEQQLIEPPAIRFTATGDHRTKQFALYCEELQGLAPTLHISREADSAAEFPALHVETGWSYHALPHGGELPPFLELLSMFGRRPSTVPQRLATWQEKIVWPAELKVFVTPQCPFCPQVLRQLLPLPLASRLVQLTIIDGMLFPELAERYGVRSVPTVLLDRQFRWTGSMTIEPILDALVHREPRQLGTATLKGMIKEGGAEQVAAMMVEASLIFPAFPELLTDPEWSTRLGAMVVVEEIAEQDPSLAATVTDSIMERIGSVADTVRGDLIYLLGTVGSPECVPRLEQLLETEQDLQMREVLREALEKLGYGNHAAQHTRGIDS